jgi:hypothetical protein
MNDDVKKHFTVPGNKLNDCGKGEIGNIEMGEPYS